MKDRLIHLPKDLPIIGKNPTISADNWVVALSYGQKFMVELTPKGGKSAAERLHQAMEAKTALVCDDALEYFTPLWPMNSADNNPGIARNVIVMSVDVAVDVTPMLLTVTGGYALSELQEVDKDAYKVIIEEALGRRKEARGRRSTVGGHIGPAM